MGSNTFEIEALLLVFPTTEYQERVPVAIGTTITDMAVDFIHENNPENVSKSWKAVCCATQSRRLVQAQWRGAIRRNFSPWASAVVLVRKKDGGLRFCIDLRKLNNRTIKDGYSLPRIEDTLGCLHGAVWFSTPDLKSGYWQVELEEEAKPLTAFTLGPLGFRECECMPIGLTNAPASFQRLMESCLGELHLNWCIIYLDDIIVFSRTPEEHLHRLKAVLNKLKAAGLKLKPSKCDLFKQQINYLGHVVSKEGVSTDPVEIKAVTKWPQLTTGTEVRSFVHFVSYYRRFHSQFLQGSQTPQQVTTELGGDMQSKEEV